MVKMKPCGHLISSSKVRKGIFKESLPEAKKEMKRQIEKLNARDTGIKEIYSKKQCKLLKKRK